MFKIIPASLQQQILNQLNDQLGYSYQAIQFGSVGGGSINQSYQIVLPGNKFYFCKINKASLLPQLFHKEAEGLAVLARQDIVRVPQVILSTIIEEHQVLILQWIESGINTTSFWKIFGEQLAALHHRTSDAFGLDWDNYMGSIPQDNTWEKNWNNFFINRRLQPLVNQSLERRLLTTKHVSLFDQLYQKLPVIFPDGDAPSLLHGDLWSGNFMCNQNSEPFLIDPVVYYGHRSVDLGMTTLFGGFDKLFYDAYHYHMPLASNYKEQWKAANLYPLLIHLLLFGESYKGRIEQTLKEFV